MFSCWYERNKDGAAYLETRRARLIYTQMSPQKIVQTHSANHFRALSDVESRLRVEDVRK